MRLRLLDIDNDIVKNNWREVKNANLPIGNKHVSGSIWDPEIFGGLGSQERKKRFAYINLKEKIFHPQAFEIIKTTGEVFSKIISKKENYIIQDKKLISNPKGETGISFLIKNIDKIDIVLNCKKEKIKDARYLEENKKLLLVDKWLVLPPEGIRDIDLSKKDSARTAFSQSEINNFYKSLLYSVTQLEIAGEDDELKDSIIEKVQKILIQITDWIQDNLMKGKQGIFRGSMLRKTMDFSTRIILNSSPDIKLGEIGLPWNALLLIYEPLITHYIYHKNRESLASINRILKKDEDEFLDLNEFNKLIQKYGKTPELIEPELLNVFEEIIREVIKDGVVQVKRDPITSRNSMYSAKPILTDGRVAKLNSMDLGPLGGDCDGDTVSVVPLFTKEAKEFSRNNMNPIYNKTKWSGNNYESNIYNISLDATASLFNATKD